MNDLCIDLGSGLGGASASFVDAGWDVVRLDFDRAFRPTVQADYTHLPFRSNLRPRIVIAAPDCAKFSMAAVYHYWKDKKPKTPETIAAIKSVKALVAEIKLLDPDYAPLENPHPGMLCHVLGQPQHKIRQSDYGSPFKKPTGIWEFGRKRLNFKWLAFQGNWLKAPRGSKTGTQGTQKTSLGRRHGAFMGVHANQLRKHHGQSAFTMKTTDKSLRALWPYRLSKAILEATEERPLP